LFGESGFLVRLGGMGVQRSERLITAMFAGLSEQEAGGNYPKSPAPI
jgi:hypothetical protein